MTDAAWYADAVLAGSRAGIARTITLVESSRTRPDREAARSGSAPDGDARYARLLKSIARAKLLILDDWGPEALTSNQARDLLEIVEDRYDKGSLV